MMDYVALETLPCGLSASEGTRVPTSACNWSNITRQDLAEARVTWTSCVGTEESVVLRDSSVVYAGAAVGQPDDVRIPGTGYDRTERGEARLTSPTCVDPNFVGDDRGRLGAGRARVDVDIQGVASLA